MPVLRCLMRLVSTSSKSWRWFERFVAGRWIFLFLEPERRSPTRPVGKYSPPTSRVGDRRSHCATALRHGQDQLRFMGREQVRMELGTFPAPRGAGVPPAGSPSVSLGVGTGGEPPPEPAAEDGRGTVALVHGPQVGPCAAGAKPTRGLTARLSRIRRQAKRFRWLRIGGTTVRARP